ncbi:MAG: riboflavin biosynthesis protein RibF [Phycisphaerales bacterium]|nr:riboflavin biosynthesis protein RibF [Phycisphaerales bacterium]
MTTIILGNFDGVHTGHQALIRTACDVSAGGEVIAVTFETHPAEFTKRETPARLTSNAMRERLLIGAGVTRVESLKVSEALLRQTPHEFIATLHNRLRFSNIVEGPDFRFGCNRSGTVETLREIGAQLGFATAVVEEAEVALHDGQLVCARSSLVRWLLARGRVADASIILGRPHCVAGIVVEGAHRGRELGFPTANIAECDAVLPADGIYEVAVEDARGKGWSGAASIGTNPTFGAGLRTLEVHMPALPFESNLYSQSLRVSFTRWIREMLRFDSVEALVAQITRDCAKVRV